MLRAEIARFTTAHTTDEVLHLASERRIPVAPLGNGETLPGFAPFVERGVFVEHPDADHGAAPRALPPEWRADPAVRPGGTARRRHPVAALGSSAHARHPRRPRRRRRPAARRPAGVRLHVVLGRSYAAQILGFLGADVVKVESVQRPDGTRMGTAYPSVGDRPWELAPLFHGANTNKREVTLDFTAARGPRDWRAGCWPRATS